MNVTKGRKIAGNVRASRKAEAPTFPAHVPVGADEFVERLDALLRRGGLDGVTRVAERRRPKLSQKTPGGLTLAPFLMIALEGGFEAYAMDGDRSARIDCARGRAIYFPSHTWAFVNFHRSCRMLRFTLEGNRLTAGRRDIEVSPETGVDDASDPLRIHVAPVEWTPAIRPLLGILDTSNEPARLQKACDLLLYEFRDMLRTGGREDRIAGEATWASIRAYLRQHYDEPIDRAAAARAFGVSPGHISRLFKRHDTMGFLDRLNEVRLEHAAAMLANPAMSVKEIANACGFNSATYFIRLFRRRFRASPGRYRSDGTIRKELTTDLPAPLVSEWQAGNTDEYRKDEMAT